MFKKLAGLVFVGLLMVGCSGDDTTFILLDCTADPQTVSIPVDMPVDITLTGSCTGGFTPVFSIVPGTGPTNGSLSGMPPNVTYTPDPGFVGIDSFTFMVTADEDPNEAAVTIRVGNTKPVAVDKSITIEEGETAVIELMGSDADGEPLMFFITKLQMHGKLKNGVAIDGGSLPFKVDPPFVEYTPVTGFTGMDSFMYVANDGFDDSDPATVKITVVPAGGGGTRLTANDQAVSTLEEIPVSITLTGTGPAGFDFALVPGSGPTNGGLSGTPPTVTYTPDAGFVGTDSFEFVTTADGSQSPPGTVTITVLEDGGSSGDAPPVCQDSSVTSDFCASVSVTLAGTDPDSPDDQLAAVIASQPFFSDLVLGAGSSERDVLVVPDPTAPEFQDTFAEDLFTFRLRDPDGNESQVCQVTVTVQGPCDAGMGRMPVARDDAAETRKGASVAIDVLANDLDLDGDPLTITAVTQGTSGAVEIIASGARVRYTPDTAPTAFVGVDTFTYTISDGTGLSDTATVTVMVINDPPNAVDDAATVVNVTVADGVLVPGVVPTPQRLDVLANDSDPNGDALTITAVTQGGDGSVRVVATDTAVEYTPNAGFTGEDTFTYTITDDMGEDDTATVTVTVVDNSRPVARDRDFVINEGESVVVNLVGDDADGDPLMFFVATLPADGILQAGGVTIASSTLPFKVVPPSVTYTPSTGFAGTDRFTYTVNDGFVDSAPARVTITVQEDTQPPPPPPGDGFPVCKDGSVTSDACEPVPVQLIGIDPDGPDSDLTFIIDSQPFFSDLVPSTSSKVAGRLIIPDPTSPEFQKPFGEDFFDFHVVDPDGNQSERCKITIIVRGPCGQLPPPPPPTLVARDDTFDVKEDTTLVVSAPGVLQNDDIITPPARVTLVDDVTFGMLTLNADGSFTYMPIMNFNGVDTFTYQFTNGENETSNVATVTITVTPAPDMLIAMDDVLFIVQGDTSPKTIAVLDNDRDPDSFDISPTGEIVSLACSAPASTCRVIDVAAPEPDNGTVLTDGTTVTYTPALDDTRDVTIIYTIARSGSAMPMPVMARIRVFFLSSTFPSPAQFNGGVLYVSPEGNDANNCQTPDTFPCRTIQAAIDQAEEAGMCEEVILVAPGTYREKIRFGRRRPIGLPGGGTGVPPTGFRCRLIAEPTGTVFGLPAGAVVLDGNQLPIANAGANQSVTLTPLQPTTVNVTLDGGASVDLDGIVTAFTWTPLSATLSEPFTPDPADVADPTVTLGPGTHRFALVVTDNDGATSMPDEVIIVVHSLVDDNLIPSAVAGLNRVVELARNPSTDAVIETSKMVTLDGSASFDPDPGESVVSWVWTPVTPTSAPPFTPDPDDVESPTVDLGEGVHTFQLVVEDDHAPPPNGVSESDTVTIIIRPTPSVRPGVSLQNESFIRVDGFEIRDFNRNGIAFDSSSGLSEEVMLTHLHIHHNDQHGLFLGRSAEPRQSLLFSDLLIHNNGNRTHPVTPSPSDQFDEYGVGCRSTEQSLFQRLAIFSNADSGMDIDECSRNTFQDLCVFNNGGTGMFFIGVNGCAAPPCNNNIQNALIYNNGRDGVHNSTSDNDFTNLTIVAHEAAGQGQGFQSTDGTMAPDARLRNSILATNNVGISDDCDVPPCVDHDFNLLFNTVDYVIATPAANEIIADPLFLDFGPPPGSGPDRILGDGPTLGAGSVPTAPEGNVQVRNVMGILQVMNDDDFRLQQGIGSEGNSPAVDAGSDSVDMIEADLGLEDDFFATRTTASDNRPDVNIVDMGYHTPTQSLPGFFCPPVSFPMQGGGD